MAADVLRIGVAGLGTVGATTVALIHRKAALLAQRTGKDIGVVAVSARDPGRDRGIDLSGCRWHQDARDLVADDGVDLVVELIGGADGIALDVCRGALERGKPLVTANKALLAHHGAELAALAEAKGVHLGFEAAVAGGIPIVKSLREGLAANGMLRVQGILNGTCNYILTAMRESGRDFQEVLDEAQALGYAEADPSFDVDGIDAAHKLALLASLAFGGPPRFDAIHIEGIRHVSALDIAFAEELGYRIKLLGLARMTDDGLEQRLHPCMVPRAAPIAQVEGVLNAVVVEGDDVDAVMHEGRGAGGGPTASAVVADIVDIARGLILPTFGVPTDRLADHAIAPMQRHRGCYYIRLMVLDRPGVLADVSAVLRDHDVSIEALIQRGRNPGQQVPIVLTSHEAEEAHMVDALAAIGRLESVIETPRMIRIEQL
ncbi:MAG: homoserine dehydrogenase [Geminicoccaceae bacterium]|nr:homoserine dehydrogenase [Geminicoccaceae bacterium]